jgi:hypothetical protein
MHFLLLVQLLALFTFHRPLSPLSSPLLFHWQPFDF